MNAQEKIVSHYKNPQNYGRPSWEPTGIYHLKNLACGDEIKMYLNLKEGKIADISFEGEGCSICIGAASILTNEVKNKDVKAVAEFRFEEFLEMLNLELNETRKKCAEISFQALKKAMETKA